MGIPIPVVAVSPVKVSSTVAKPYLVTNIGTATIYLGKSSSVSPTAYDYPLAPGNALQWTEINSDVYAVCDPGKSSQAVVAIEASAVSLGSVTATINQTVSVAGIVQTQQVAGFDLLDTLTVNLPAGNPGSFMVGGAILTNLKNYNSLYITYENGITGVANPSAANYVHVAVRFDGLVSGYDCQFWQYQSTPDANTYQVPITGKTAQINFDGTKTAGTAGTITVRVYGTYQPLTTDLYYQAPLGFGFSGYANINTYPAVGNFSFFPATTNLPMQLGVYKVTAAGAGTVAVLSQQIGTIYPIAGTIVDAALPSRATTLQELRLKNAPVRVDVGNTAGSFNVYTSY